MKSGQNINNGIYIHIPFCKQACHYCNFHFNVNISQIENMVNSIIKEIELQKNYLKGPINSLYIGGGTPSLLEKDHLYKILNSVYKNFSFKDNLEITFEANPDDLTNSKLKELKILNINRLSIGIQSFNDSNLKFINRAHNSEKAIKSFKLARDNNFDNINIDLIYGIPNSNLEIWQKDLEITLSLLPEHISSYCLTIENNSFFGNLYSRNKLKVVGEDQESVLFDIMIDTLKKNGYEHYEVSNFCLPNKYSKHNSNYWKKGYYLGIGPSAHSYNGLSRQWNISSNKKYIQNISLGIIPFEKEILTNKDHINEFIMTGLRTKWGCNLNKLKENFDYDLISESEDYIENLINNELLIFEKNIIKATQKGFKLCDKIASNLFIN